MPFAEPQNIPTNRAFNTDAPETDMTFDAESVAKEVVNREREKDALIDNLKFQITELRKLIWQMYTGSN